MDEATASIDETTEQHVIKVMEENLTDCTVLTVAHRVKTLEKHDKFSFKQNYCFGLWHASRGNNTRINE